MSVGKTPSTPTASCAARWPTTCGSTAVAVPVMPRSSVSAGVCWNRAATIIVICVGVQASAADGSQCVVESGENGAFRLILSQFVCLDCSTYRHLPSPPVVLLLFCRLLPVEPIKCFRFEDFRWWCFFSYDFYYTWPIVGFCCLRTLIIIY